MSRVAVDTLPPSDMAAWLARASGWMFASLALQPPSPQRIDRMRDLVPLLPETVQPAASVILTLPLAEWEPEFFSVLGPAGCPACESSYERAAMAARGPLLADVSGYYRAFAYAPAPPREVPDHASVELDFLSYMAVKIACAEFECRVEDAGTTRDAYESFRRTHLGAWIDQLCAALVDTGSPQYQSIGRFIQALTGLAGATPEEAAVH
jgi:nitrate reductase assembly molybdenum cofactor insertion protein NarJ